MKLIVGLGNPGEKYQASRHNLGFLVVESLVKDLNKKFRNSIFAKARVAHFNRNREEIIIALPKTFMNLSGDAVHYLVKRKKIALKDILVICDDVNLNFRQMRARASGSAGGHKGLESIINRLKSNGFARLRLGIGSTGVSDLSNFVLSDFSREEKKDLNRVIKTAVEAVYCWLDFGIDKAMNNYNYKENYERI